MLESLKIFSKGRAKSVDDIDDALRETVPSIKCYFGKTRTQVDVSNKEYTLYEIIVKHQSSLQWTISKRFSAFVTLHKELLSQTRMDVDRIPRHRLPSLPSKLSKKVSVRMPALETYLNELLRLHEEMPNSKILSFLGMLSPLISDDAKMQDKNFSRNSIPISRMEKECDSGDLLLFKGKATLSKLQRTFTGADYDHCALVVRVSARCHAANTERRRHFYRNTDGAEPPRLTWEAVSYKSEGSLLFLLESTGDGVTMMPLISRLNAYNYFQCVQYITLRKLNVQDSVSRFVNKDQNIDDAQCPSVLDSQLQSFSLFLNEVVGKPYGIKISKLVLNVGRSPFKPMRNSETKTPLSISSSAVKATPERRYSRSVSPIPQSPGAFQSVADASSPNPSPSPSSARYMFFPHSVAKAEGTKNSSTFMAQLHQRLFKGSQDINDAESEEEEKLSTAENCKTPPRPSETRKSGSTQQDILDGGECSRGMREVMSEEKYFCSELVAAALKTMGVLPSEIIEDYFWPGSFGVAQDIDRHIIEPHFYGGEFLIDYRVLEVATLKAVQPMNSGVSKPASIMEQLSDATLKLQQSNSISCAEEESASLLVAPAATFVPSV